MARSRFSRRCWTRLARSTPSMGSGDGLGQKRISLLLLLQLVASCCRFAVVGFAGAAGADAPFRMPSMEHTVRKWGPVTLRSARGVCTGQRLASFACGAAALA
ncbi:unnamed protein product [Prorocentrum cordatum]|uniref:Uncharacterized protein n=1 Tax=Prorocentrum cordatum TaxID=2364126 RepID=A0ABN9ST98_9DINO|nr:unnamed protein product [Polarella glacialis]